MAGYRTHCASLHWHAAFCSLRCRYPSVSGRLKLFTRPSCRRTILYIERAKSAARRERIRKLKVEREMERHDKIYLLKKYFITLDDEPAY